MKKTLSALLLFQFFFSNSQVLQVNNTMTPEELVQNILVGTGVQVFNITFSGDPLSIASFDGTGTNLGFNSGILLACGEASSAVGPNSSGSTGSDLGRPGDPDIDIITNNSTFDAAVLEFDFIPSSDTIKFNYIFGSEEYMEWVNGAVNDGFGFFISGPGINGTFSNNSINLALIPGSNEYVTIDNVNENNNGQFYFNNENPPGQFVEYDGFTVPLVATTVVQCGETYHLKLVVADAGDGIYDSGVFLEANSLSVTGVNLDLSTVTGSSTVYEGTCSVADFILSRQGCLIDQPLTLDYVFSGTATQNVDYVVSPAGNSITFQPFEDTIVLSMVGILEVPNLVENDETIIFTATYVNQLGITVTISDTLVMSENAIIAANSNDPIIICPEDSVLLAVEAIGGTAPYIYSWQGGQMGDTAYFPMPTPGIENVVVVIEDFCGFTFFDTVPITFPDPGPITFVPQDVTVFCPTNQVTITAGVINGVAPYSFSWNTGASGTSIVDSIFINNTSHSYTVTVTDACGFTDQGVTTLTLNQTLNIDDLSPTASQLCVDNGSITPTVVGETGAIQYFWTGPAPDTNTVTNTEIHSDVAPGWYYLRVADDVCSDRDSVYVDSIPNPVASFNFVDPSGDPPITIVFDNTSINANQYDWDFGNGDNILTVNTLDDQNGIYQDTGTYLVTLTASNSPCTSSVTQSFVIKFEPKVTITDIFSPNGDNRNEVFSIKPMFFAEFTIQIFNRWGELMFEGDRVGPDWDGKAPSGKPASEGVYFYKYRGTGYSGTVLEGHGNLQLTR